jgi:hypothetical protein
MPGVSECGPEEQMERHIVLVVGLNIRDQSRISLEEQRLALAAIAKDLELLRVVGDKGSYLVSSRHLSDQVVTLVLGALVAHKRDLKIPGAALVSPTVLVRALATLASTLRAKYGNDFAMQDHGIKIGDDTWRAGLAMPVFPLQLPPDRTIFHKLKNSIVFGWTHGSVLVAKREAKNVHWGTTVTGPASSQMSLHDGVRVEFTSRSANVLRDLVG